jgi:hypothetical protein
MAPTRCLGVCLVQHPECQRTAQGAERPMDGVDSRPTSQNPTLHGAFSRLFFKRNFTLSDRSTTGRVGNDVE